MSSPLAAWAQASAGLLDYPFERLLPGNRASLLHPAFSFRTAPLPVLLPTAYAVLPWLLPNHHH